MTTTYAVHGRAEVAHAGLGNIEFRTAEAC